MADPDRSDRTDAAALSECDLVGHIAAMAQTAPYEEVLPQKRWTLDLGGGPVYGFSANGRRARKTRLTLGQPELQGSGLREWPRRRGL